MTESSAHPRIVVGYDGSRYADAAVTWAARHALECGGDLELVTVWQWPMTYGFALDLGDYTPETDAAQMVQQAAEKSGLPADRIRTVVLEGPAAAQLVAQGRGADTLVVGTRGHNDFSDLLLGSVSNYCTHHAECTVVIVRISPSVTPDTSVSS
jgi:nucleotide-binding universal stress UspA family protein